MVSPTTRMASPLDGFSGTIAPTKVGLFYKLGLVCVAFAMVLLPVIYVALILLTAWVVLWHIGTNTWIFSGLTGQAAFYAFGIYLIPAFAGMTLVSFMVKPFFAPKAKTPECISLDRAKEPLIFAFVEKVCGLVGAPAPSRIDVDCQVNASASLRYGISSKELVLTIGLPLLSGLEMRQFAGIMAHEFGHFAQGAGMRLTYIIRKINGWFARIVYERDEWDLKLEQSARRGDFRIRVFFKAAKGAVSLSRKILSFLMHVGHGISCFMMRQMEYDADNYAAKLAGSDAFEPTGTKMRLLQAASQMAYEDMRQSWASKRLPENLMVLIQHKAESLSPEVQQNLLGSVESRKTGWFDTHPCNADRNKAVQQINAPGVFRSVEPASKLISNFDELSKTVTQHQYEKNFGLKFTAENLISAEEIVRESAASSAADEVVVKYFGQVNVSLLPVLTSGELPSSDVDENMAARVSDAWQRLESLREAAEKISGECAQKESRLNNLAGVYELTQVGFKVNPMVHGLPESATTPGEQEIAAKWAIADLRKELPSSIDSLKPFFNALQQVLVLKLQIALAHPKSAEDAEALRELVRVLAAVGPEMARAREVYAKLQVLKVLAANQRNHSNPQDIGEALMRISCEVKKVVSGVRERLQVFAYPFPHARGKLTVAEYLAPEQSGDGEIHRVFLEANAQVEGLFALNYRAIGRLLVCAENANKHSK